MPFPTPFGSVEQIRARIASVLGGLDLTLDQDVIVAHADLSAAAVVAGIDRYWALRIVNHGTSGDICVRLEHNSTDFFPGTLQYEQCTPRSYLPTGDLMAAWATVWLVGLLPGFSVVSTTVPPLPPPPLPVVVDTLPDDDPVTVYPGGGDPGSTDSPDDASVWGAHCRWLDLSGRYRDTFYYANSLDAAQRIATALQLCSTALMVEFWAGVVQQTTGEVNPEHQAYALAADEVRIAVEFGGTLHESVTLPAPRDDLFLADQLTLNIADGDAALLVDELVGHLYSPNAATVATGVAAASIRSREAPGGTL